MSQMRLIRIFLSSPGDVTEERALAQQVIEKLPLDRVLQGHVTLEAVAWDRKGTGVPLVANLTPQEAIKQGLAKPSDCDIVVVIFWSRMGTPLPKEYARSGGTQYLSGTEWEYENAINASKHNGGKPAVLVYRRMEEPQIGLRDPQRDSKIAQWEGVESFFRGFSNPDGSIRQGYHRYDKSNEFAEQLELHLKNLLIRFLNIDSSSDEDQRLLTQVRLAAADWQRNGRDKPFLWTQERLNPAYVAIERLKPDLDEVTRDFIRPELERLMDELNDINTTHSRRAQIGDRLAEIGDTRPGVGLRPDGLPDIVWCDVLDGVVIMEIGKRKKARQETVEVTPFKIAKYPITYVQYRAFWEAADGYRERRWWSGLKYNPEARKQNRPVDNHPAEMVTWYAAMAFCRWLTAKLGFAVRLPTEWEWQQAATGGDPENQYPWGKGRDSRRANSAESLLNRTVAVGMYPHGAQPKVGALDLAGNVWEWCLNEYGDIHVIAPSGATRGLRGGSWWNYKSTDLRAVYRSGYPPDERSLRDKGFRCVCAMSAHTACGRLP